MPQGTVELRDAKRIRELTPDFLTRDEHFLAGSRLSAPLYEHRHGGGALMYAFGADHPAIESYIGSQQLTAPNVGFADWSTTANGGPYVNLDGATEALYINDAAWQEAGANTLLVWHWVHLAALATGNIATKYDINGLNRSWALGYSAATGFPYWICNNTGAGAGDVILSSSISISATTWYFIAGFYDPSSLMRIYVGTATAESVSSDSLAVGIPASLRDGTAPLAIGTAFNTAPTLLNPWQGYEGEGGARGAVPAANMDAFVNQLFAETQTKYL